MYLKTFTCAVVAAFVAPVFAGEAWLTNIDKAMEQAAKEKKAVLVEFSGSDWCPPCMALKKDVFNSDEFKKMADKNLVLVELDFPRSKEISEEQKKYNQEMSTKYEIEGFPTVYILNDKGLIYWKRVGGGEKKEYLESLEKALKNKDAIQTSIDKASKASGLEKAKLLDEALKAMDPETKTANSIVLADEIIALDKDDTLGYAKLKKQAVLETEQKKALEDFARKEFAPLMKDQKYDEALAKVDEYLKKPDLLNSTKMQIKAFSAQVYLMNEDIDKAVSALEEAVKMAPESMEAKQMEAFANHIKENKEKILGDVKKMKKM